MTKAEFRIARARNRRLFAKERRDRRWARALKRLASLMGSYLQERTHHEELFARLLLPATWDPLIEVARTSTLP